MKLEVLILADRFDVGRSYALRHLEISSPNSGQTDSRVADVVINNRIVAVIGRIPILRELLQAYQVARLALDELVGSRANWSGGKILLCGGLRGHHHSGAVAEHRQ